MCNIENTLIFYIDYIFSGGFKSVKLMVSTDSLFIIPTLPTVYGAAIGK